MEPYKQVVKKLFVNISTHDNQVCHGIDRSTVNWDLVVMDPTTDDDKTNNAKYAISVARKLGACVFVAAEDIVQVMSRMIMLFCASLWHCENERTAAPEEAAAAAAFPAPAVLETPQVRVFCFVLLCSCVCVRADVRTWEDVCGCGSCCICVLFLCVSSCLSVWGGCVWVCVGVVFFSAMSCECLLLVASMRVVWVCMV